MYLKNVFTLWPDNVQKHIIKMEFYSNQNLSLIMLTKTYQKCQPDNVQKLIIKMEFYSKQIFCYKLWIMSRIISMELNSIWLPSMEIWFSANLSFDPIKDEKFQPIYKRKTPLQNAAERGQLPVCQFMLDIFKNVFIL